MGSGQNSNSFMLLWLFLLPARMKKIHLRMKPLEWSHHFSHYKSMGIFPDTQGQLTLQSLVGSCQISNPFQDLMVVLVICKNEDPLIMKEIELSHDFPCYNPMGAICCHRNRSSDPIWPKMQCSKSLTLMMLQMNFD